MSEPIVTPADLGLPDTLFGIPMVVKQPKSMVAEALRLRECLLRIAARGGDWSYPDLLANVADALEMKLSDLEKLINPV